LTFYRWSFSYQKKRTSRWIGETNHCEVPDCDVASVTVSKPVTVTVAGQGGQPYPGLRVYAFTDSTYSGYSSTTDANGHVTFSLPPGEYRFRADYDGVQFWSSDVNACQVVSTSSTQAPGCESASVTLPGGTGEMNASIEYEYDPLNRLVKATYTDPNNPAAVERTYEYTYDAVGNRLSQTITIDGLAAVTLYEYDAANRLVSVTSGQHPVTSYEWDANGNLLSDGVNTYTYDTANRLVSVSNQSSVISYQYSGLGDRLTETVNGVTTTFTMDLNTGLTQALSDGTHEYLYAHTRLAQVHLTPDTGTPDTLEYFLGDALGSVRQLTDSTGAVTFARTYDPYGVTTTATGNSASAYGFTSECTDPGGLVYLRARHYAPGRGRFLTRDTWPGEVNRPHSLNRWGYVEGNPVNFVDPTGHYPIIDFYRIGAYLRFSK
jgi:RHS repeat-associated protein